MWAALKALYPQLKLDLEAVRTSTPALATADPNFTKAQTFAACYGAELVYNRRINNPRELFSRRQGVYLVQLDITTADGSYNHYVTYLAATGHVVDNYPRGPVPVIVEAERKSNKRAIQVFGQLFPSAQRIFMRAVSELRHPSIWSMATPPTLEDMFLELYHDKVITKEEYLECAFKLN